MIANISWNATNTVCGIVPNKAMSTAALPQLRCRIGGHRGDGVTADESLEAEVLAWVTERLNLSLPKATEYP